MSEVQAFEKSALDMDTGMMLDGIANIAVPPGKPTEVMACAEGGRLGMQGGQGGGGAFMSSEGHKRKRSRFMKVFLYAHVFVDHRKGAATIVSRVF